MENEEIKVSDRFDLTIIVPVFNEEENLPGVTNELSDFMRNAKFRTRILFVNDGSTDNSSSLIEAICQKSELFSFIHLKENKGLSTALKAGIDQVETWLTGYIDADLQTSPSDFNKLLEFAQEFELVNGARINRKDGLIKRVSSSVANAFRRTVIKDGITDTGCPLKIIKTETAKKLPFFDGMHRFLPALVLMAGGTVKEVPINHYPRRAGKSKYHLFNRITGPFCDLLAFRWMKKNYIHYEIMKKG